MSAWRELSQLLATSRLVVFTSPDERWLRTAAKFLGTVYMPLWTHEASDVLHLPIDGKFLDKRFDVFGSVAPQCLSQSQRDTDTWLTEMGSVIRWTTGPSKLTFLLCTKQTKEMHHRVLHYEPSPAKRHEKTTKLASAYVVEVLSENILALVDVHRAKLRLALQGVSEGAQLRGWLFEMEVHRMLQKSHVLSLRSLQGNSGEDETFAIEKTEHVVPYDTRSLLPQMVASAGPYHHPKSKTQESIDGFYIAKASHGQDLVEWNKTNPILLFQITVTGSHSVNACGVVHVLKNLGLMESIAENPHRAKLVFVTPQYVVKDFVRQRVTTMIPWSDSANVGPICGIGKQVSALLAEHRIYSVGDLRQVVAQEKRPRDLTPTQKSLWGMTMTSYRTEACRQTDDRTNEEAVKKMPRMCGPVAIFTACFKMLG